MSFDYSDRLHTSIHDQAIGKLLDSLRMQSSFFTQSWLTKPWAMSMPAMSNCMMFHIVAEGQATFQINQQQLLLSSGDFVLFPRGDGHELSDGSCTDYTPLRDLPIIPITQRYETLHYGGEGEHTSMVCGVLLFQHPLAIKLLGILPSTILIRHNSAPEVDLVSHINRLLEAETQQLGIGAEAVIARLADILVIAAMRQYLSELSDEKIGWLGALEDDRIGKALAMIHDSPEKHWSLGELAKQVGMSRTLFAQQFKRLVGNAPMEYLTEWRMSIAYSKLQLSKNSVLSIALDVGYQSESAFSRAFKKVIGQSPNEIRKAYQNSA